MVSLTHGNTCSLLVYIMFFLWAATGFNSFWSKFRDFHSYSNNYLLGYSKTIVFLSSDSTELSSTTWLNFDVHVKFSYVFPLESNNFIRLLTRLCLLCIVSNSLAPLEREASWKSCSSNEDCFHGFLDHNSWNIPLQPFHYRTYARQMFMVWWWRCWGYMQHFDWVQLLL